MNTPSTKFVVWFKQGYWYAADVQRQVTHCSKSLEEAHWLNGLVLVKQEGGAYFYA